MCNDNCRNRYERQDDNRRKQFRYDGLGIGDRQGPPEENALVLALGIQAIERVKRRQDRKREQEHPRRTEEKDRQRSSPLCISGYVRCAEQRHVDLFIERRHRDHPGQRNQRHDHGYRDRRHVDRAVLPDLAPYQSQLVSNHAAAPLTLATNRSATDGVCSSPSVSRRSRSGFSNSMTFLPKTSRSAIGPMFRACSAFSPDVRSST